MDAPRPIRPCFFMKMLLSAACDNTLSGLSRWFMNWHVAHCPRCRVALVALQELHRRLRALAAPQADAADHLPAERWARLEAAWAEADQRT
jgi:predicted anti-sigma-YlaC factor YlaD